MFFFSVDMFSRALVAFWFFGRGFWGMVRFELWRGFVWAFGGVGVVFCDAHRWRSGF